MLILPTTDTQIYNEQLDIDNNNDNDAKKEYDNI